jgi:type I restriction enzyme, S subunit
MDVFTKNEIPDSWAWSTFGDWLDIQGGSQPAKKFFSDTPKEGYVQLYQIRDLGEKPVPVFVDRKKVTKFCADGDILIGRYGASVGKVFWAKEGAYNVALVKLLFDERIFDKSFLFFFLKSQYFQRRLGMISKTAQDGFNKSELSTFPLPIAPLNEQRRIVSKIEEPFSDLDAGEAALQRVQKLLASYRQAVLKAAVTGELTKEWRETNQQRLESGEALLQRILKARREQW